MKGRLPLLFGLLGIIVAACGTADDSVPEAITVYSGRSEELVAPLIEQFEEESGVDVAVRYGDSAELAATIIEEGANSPADVFFAQDPASLGVVAVSGLFASLDNGLVDRVPSEFSDNENRWVGVSGRARVVVYDTQRIDPATLPAGEDGFVEPTWAGRVAIAPTNGSFLAFVAAKILLDGEAVTLEWLEGMAANGAPTYPSNSVIVAAVDEGEVDAGLVNHYYLFRRQDEVGDTIASNHFLTGGGAGSLVMPAGAGILASSENMSAAEAFINFLLGNDAQTYFANETFEYPLSAGVAADPALPPIASLNPPQLDLSELANTLDRATDLVAEAGLL